MAEVFREVLRSPIGPVGFGFDEDGCLLRIMLPYETADPRRPGEQRPARLRPAGRRPRGAPARAALERWLRGVLAGREPAFPGRWELPGEGAFERRVYRAVKALPPGRTSTYGRIAARCGSAGAARAVGNAMARNPLPLLVPCHRVLGASGLGGYGGGLELKSELLRREGAQPAAPGAAVQLPSSLPAR